ncbi:hypothetical protein WJX75_005037 [Coccomyxa subellipsoidea]|uniref:glutathione gamma-glutamylcysteinyltransferase n=1 Tax=Coccomyxa subellipsoidea TaxID=248742 RepID=A0ABR2YGF9_9CHLO
MPTAESPAAAPHSGVIKTFYKRHLPSPPATSFSSLEGKQLFAEALLDGTMEGFFKLIEQFRTQDEPAYCGLASLAMVLNTLAIDPRRAWKGPWRWFHEQMLDCCLPILRVAEEGIVLHQAACLARCNGAKVEVRQSGSFSVEEFREDVRQASRSEAEHLIVSYSRKQFLQTGDGHFSPVGGYHAGKDLVLILDTARFKYPPHWVPLTELFEAMKRVDPTTSQPRGYLKMGAFPRLDSVLFTLKRRGEGWQQAPGFWQTSLPQLLASSAVDSAMTAIFAAVRSAPLQSLVHFVAVRQSSPCSDISDVPCSQPAVVTTLLNEIRGLELHRFVVDALKENSTCNACHALVQQADFLAERLTVFLLLAPKHVWNSIQNSSVLAEVGKLMEIAPSSILATELEYLGNQQSELTKDRIKIPDSSFSGANVSSPFFPNGNDEKLNSSERDSLEAKLSDQIKKHHSLHGAVAAKRQATTELLFFASVGDISRIKRICETWGIMVADESCRDYDKRTPLHLAAAEGCYSVVQWLLTEGKCDANPIDRFLRTPLEDAVRGDHGEVVQLLVSNGAKLYKKKEGGLVELRVSRLSGFVRMWDDDDEALQPEWEIDPKDLQILEKVGEGEFGTVHKAKWYGTIVAVKILRRSDAVAVGDFRTELNTLQKVHHPHAVQFLGAATHSQPYMIVTEFLPGGSLTDLFKRVHSGAAAPPSLRRATEMALDCARGMQYLHARNKNKMSCMHRDLKPANLMLGGIPHDSVDRDIAAELGVVKIADFGLSKSLAQNVSAARSRSRMDLDRDLEDGMEGHQLERYKLTGETGSYRYMAPEVFRHEPYNTKVDVYAFSMIAYELFEGAIPFGHLHPVEAARRAAMNHARPTWGKYNRFGKPVPQEIMTLVEECWDLHPDKRPSFSMIAKRLQVLFDAMPPDSKKKKKCCIM